MVDPLICSLLRVRGKSVAGLLQQFRRHLQVSLRRVNVGVPEVGSQTGQELLYVLTRAIPRQYTMNGRGVSKVVESWRSWLPRRASNASHRANPLEQRDDVVVGQLAASTRAQERRIPGLRHWQCTALVEVGRQSNRKLQSDWNQAGLVEFCVS